MPSKKIKISELPLVESLKGLYTIGYKIIDGIKTSVKVSLEDIQTAYQDVVNAIKKSEEAAKNANNAASNAEEKAEAANTAAQDAEKVANNPTYIGTDHYVYVYNKETDSFDKTGIYCKGEPGSSFRIAGEYATLEALKSAVPDGSAVDGFMAVGTEAPYDYYAWVNGNWVNQGKIAGGGSGNVVIVPIMGLTTQSTSDEIFNAFGGKQNLIDIIKKVKDEDCVVIAKTDDDPNAVVQQTFSVVNATYVNDNNLILGLISWSVNVTSQMIIQVIDGVASYNEISTPLMTEAPSNSNAYGRKNKGWVEVPEKSDVLTKDNETEYNPTQHYHPATKAYVDDIGYGRTITITAADKFLNTANLSGVDAEQRVIDLFGSLDIFKRVVANILANHVRYYFHFGDNPNNDCIELGCVNAWRANNNSSHKLNFIITYYDENNLYTNRISIVVNNDTAASKVIIASLVNSDNVATLTKKTSTEYSNINPKADNTAYLVTDD